MDSLVHSYTPSFPPIVYGDTRNLRMAPHNVSYAYMPEHLKRASVKFEIPFSEHDNLSDQFQESINNFRTPVQLAKGDATNSP